MTADSLQKQSQGRAGRLFEKGQSGNPGGRRTGCRNRATQRHVTNALRKRRDNRFGNRR